MQRNCRRAAGNLPAVPNRRKLSSNRAAPTEGNPMRYNRISADCHLDMPWMPPTLFTENASHELKDRMPYVADGPDGPMWVTKNGANFGLKNGVGPSGAKLIPGQNRRVDIMAETGLFADGQKDIRRVSTA